MISDEFRIVSFSLHLFLTRNNYEPHEKNDSSRVDAYHDAGTELILANYPSTNDRHGMVDQPSASTCANTLCPYWPTRS
ncbi:hypothetical protein THF1A12_170096 [Vibrio jasicida]|uniref:Uncharacterized protein n=1 Tax=Vibrio jasicida TaxID=766224 RepID=A0AAU9QLH3_9VIBR|nr:hypothetical protein THF1A12_170096 [Vibrio jasicida]